MGQIYLCGGGPVPDTRSGCPNRGDHTPQPRGYNNWHDWAREKAKTHHQKKCGGCGLWKIWTPKEARSDA